MRLPGKKKLYQVNFSRLIIFVYQVSKKIGLPDDVHFENVQNLPGREILSQVNATRQIPPGKTKNPQILYP